MRAEITVTATAGERTVFLIEVAQAGVFSLQGATPENLQPVLAMHCPAILFPYARQAIASATINAGYPPVHLQPLSFEALYQQQLAQKGAAGRKWYEEHSGWPRAVGAWHAALTR